MRSKSRLKRVITEAVLKQLPDETRSAETLIQEWWFTRSGESLRLSHTGDMVFRSAEIEYFDLPLSVKHTTWHAFIIECGRKLDCPFYISITKKKDEQNEPFIRLYDSKIAVLMSLYGDIHSYLDSIKK